MVLEVIPQSFEINLREIQNRGSCTLKMQVCMDFVLKQNL